MAKRARAPAALLALLMTPAVQAEVKFTPSIGATETYSDNVGLATEGNAQSAFITELTPGFSAFSNGPRLQLNAGYQLHLYSYSADANNTANSSSQYQMSLNAKVIDNLLDLSASAIRQTTSLSAFGPQGTDSLYSDNNRTTVNTFSVSPTLRHRFGSTADAYLRYTYNRVSGGAFGTSNGQNIAANVTSGEKFSVVGWGLSAVQDTFSDDTLGSSRSENVEGNLRYRVSYALSLTATAGYDRYDYASQDGESTGGASYTGGFIWTPSSRTRLQASYGRRFYGNTGNMSFTFRGHRSALNASYTDNVTTSRQQFLASSALSTTSLLDAMLTASIPDAAERQKAIAAYLAATGVSSSFTNNTNYLSNVFQRQKSFQVGYSLESAHGTASVSIYKTRSAALSMQQANSDLFGQSLGSLNNNLDSIGGTAGYTYRLSQATQAVASLNYQRSKTLDSDISTDTESGRLGLSHAFSRKLSGSAEIRQQRGSYYNVGNGRFREHAISATILMQF